MYFNCLIRSADLISFKYSTPKETAALKFDNRMFDEVVGCHTLNQTYQRRGITFKWEMQSAQNMNVMYIIFYSEGDLQDVDS